MKKFSALYEKTCVEMGRQGTAVDFGRELTENEAIILHLMWWDMIEIVDGKKEKWPEHPAQWISTSYGCWFHPEDVIKDLDATKEEDKMAFMALPNPLPLKETTKLLNSMVRRGLLKKFAKIVRNKNYGMVYTVSDRTKKIVDESGVGGPHNRGRLVVMKKEKADDN